MFRYDERAKRAALDYYFGEGACDAVATCKALGYPNAATLRGWASRDPRRGTGRKANGNEYGSKVRGRALALLSRGDSLGAAARKVGVSKTVVYNWSRRMSDAGVPMGGPAGNPEGAMREEDIPHDVDELRALVRKMDLENAVMREVLDVLKADPLADARGLTSRERAAVVARLRGSYPVDALCAVAGIARSTCYWCWAHPEADPDADIRGEVVAAFEGANASRGYRYVKREVDSALGRPVSEKRVRRVMSQEGCEVVYLRKGRRRYSSYAGETNQAPPNLVGRDFRAGLPNFLWLVDITEFRLPCGDKVYLNPVIDCFDGRPAAWGIGRHPDSGLVDGSLLDAISRREGWESTMVHGDRGVQNRSASFIAICEANGIVRSMSAKGCSPDNSACEGFFGRLKNEFFYYRDWRGVSTEEFMARLDAYMRYYCEERPKESLGWMSPNQYRRSLGFTA